MDYLSLLTQQHRKALEWFFKRTGETVSWPEELPDGTLLVTHAKGICKPQWSKYALSVRQTLGGPYPDEEPVSRDDGTWFYRYYQENKDANARDNAYTNVGLINCLKDSVPVGVMRQVSKKPSPSRYEVLGIAFVAGWDGGYFSFEGFSKEGFTHARNPSGQIQSIINNEEQVQIEDGSFNPRSIDDGRKRVIASIVRRRGQPQFRKKLLSLYDCRCAFSDCNVENALEAAHIVPYNGAETNHPTNGLLLRADLHTLFDLGPITIHPSAYEIIISEDLRNSCYKSLKGKKINLPKDKSAIPATDALESHRQWSGL